MSFDRNVVAVRKNAWRKLKSRHSTRTIPLWPQLAEILLAYLNGPHAPPDDGLLFPSPRTGGVIHDTRKALDAIGTRAGWKDGEIRLHQLRHTYCAARLQTLDRGAPVSEYTVMRELGHSSPTLVRRIYGHLGEIRHRAEVVEYRVEQHRERLKEQLRLIA